MRFAVPPGLRPRAVEPVVTKLKLSMASMGKMTPAIAETPPWLTAGMFHQKSLLSVPSICQFTEFGPGSIDAGVSTAATCVVAGESGGLSHHLREVATTVRNILYNYLRQDGGLEVGDGIEGQGSGRDFYCLIGRREAELRGNGVA